MSVVGTVVAGKYRLDRVLGKGGMGVVYEATNESVGRRVALKRVWAAGADDVDMVGRLQREARATAAIHSPNVVEILDVLRDENDELWVVMELLEGEALSSRIQRCGSLEVDESAAIVSQVLAGLEAAHAQSIVHRDLKPANIFLHRRADGATAVKILDFGISKWIGQTTGAGRMTATGAMLGTPSYMSPEQAKASRDADERSDVYSVGAVLYECLTGQPPYGVDSYPVVLGRLMTQDPLDVTELRPGLGPGIVDVVRRAMARDPEDRFQTAAAMRAALEANVEVGEPRPVPRTQSRPDVPAVVPREPHTEPTATPFAGESMRPERRHSPIAWIAAGAGVGVVVAVGWLVVSGIEAPPAPRLTSAPLAPPPVLAPPPTTVAAHPAPSPAPLPLPVPAPAASRKLRVVVQPPTAHARVVVTLRSGVEVASSETPAAFELPGGDEVVRLTVRANGYVAVTRAIEPGAEEIEVPLERATPARRSHGPTIDDRNPLR